MPEKYDPAASENVIVQRCYERHYIFFYAEHEERNMTMLGNAIQSLVNGNVIEIHAGLFGVSKLPGYRVTVELEIECQDDPDMEKPGPDHKTPTLDDLFFKPV